MNAERQPGRLYQRRPFEQPTESLRHDASGEGGTGPAACEESQAFTAFDHARALTQHLMEEVVTRENLNRAYRRVKANQGAPGVDGMTLHELGDWIQEHKQALTAGQRVLASLTAFLEGKLRLRVNRTKSAVAHVEERKFLGHRLLTGGTLTVAPASLDRAKDRVRQITRRNRGVSFEQVIGELSSFLTGWVTYFRYAKAREALRVLDQWIRRKLRCVRLKQRKRASSIAAFLRRLGVPSARCWTAAACGKGWWRMSHTPAAQQGMDNAWFQTQGLIALVPRYLELQQ